MGLSSSKAHAPRRGKEAKEFNGLASEAGLKSLSETHAFSLDTLQTSQVFSVRIAVLRTAKQGDFMRILKALISVALLLTAVSCVPVVFPEDSLPMYEERPIFGVFGHSFDEVWTATTEALDLYPIEIAEKERGLLVTEWMIGTSDYIYIQYGATRIPEKIRYRMRIHVISRDGRTICKIINHEMVEKDMISGNLEFSGAVYTWVDVPSSTSKEREILEKIRRNLGMDADLNMEEG